MTIERGYGLGPKLLEVLGITNEEVKKLTLICPADGVVEVIVEKYVKEDQSNKIVTILEEYTICEKEEEN